MNKQEFSKTLCQSVEDAVGKLLVDLDDTAPANLHELVLNQTEKPLIKTILKYSKNNQSKAAECLGISRSTLRKKIAKHKL